MPTHAFIFLLLLCLATRAGAHEFWILPQSFLLPQAPTAVNLMLSVGEEFTGEPVAFSRALVADFRGVAVTGSTELREHLPAAPRRLLRLPLDGKGTHVLALVTHASRNDLDADKFHAYLREDGLEHVLRLREQRGQLQQPGRERYRRNIKTLVAIGPPGGGGHAVRAGHTLELIPGSDPLQHRAGDDMVLHVEFEGRPLGNALVKFWHRRGGRTEILSQRSDPQGRVVARLAWPGRWMASVVHMVPATDASGHDWDSYWGNLTFAVPQPP